MDQLYILREGFKVPVSDRNSNSFLIISGDNLVVPSFDNTVKVTGSIQQVSILDFKLNKLPKEILLEAKKLLPNSNYIGFSITQGNKYRKKTWPLEKFIYVANNLKNELPVFFIEKNNHKLIEEVSSKVKKAIFPEMNTLLSCPALITALSTRLKKAITIDNGIMHMMNLANIPMVTLFGPTNSDKFAPKKQNVVILDSKKLYNSNEISKITETDVLKEI